jgi:hypothetical protein
MASASPDTRSAILVNSMPPPGIRVTKIQPYAGQPVDLGQFDAVRGIKATKI